MRQSLGLRVRVSKSPSSSFFVRPLGRSADYESVFLHVLPGQRVKIRFSLLLGLRFFFFLLRGEDRVPDYDDERRRAEADDTTTKDEEPSRAERYDTKGRRRKRPKGPAERTGRRRKNMGMDEGRETTPPECGTVETTPPDCGTTDTPPLDCGTVETTPPHCGSAETTPLDCGTRAPIVSISATASFQFPHQLFFTCPLYKCRGAA
jgi:hypothetical protein